MYVKSFERNDERGVSSTEISGCKNSISKLQKKNA